MRALHFLLTLFATGGVSAQNKGDYQWILGYDTSLLVPGGNAIALNFNYCPVSVYNIPTVHNFWMEGSNTSMSGENGQLLFYSNGCYIVDASGAIMERGDTINPGLIQTTYCSSGGSPWSQGVIALPAPGSESLFYLFNLDMELPYLSIDSFIGIAPQRLYYQLVDMAQAAGLGKVTAKNQIAVQDTLARGNVQAVRHANGIDWWVITPKSHSDCYFLNLITAQGVQPPVLRCAGTVWNDYDTQGQAVFSPDGTKYIRFNAWNGLNIFDFDAQTGGLSNAVHIEFPNDTFHVAGVAVSSNSRYLYASALKKIYQFDLLAPDIEASKTLIGQWDGYAIPYPTIFYLAALAPDGRIYIAGTSSHRFLHVVNHPDSSGTQCGFEQRGLSLPSYNFATIPNFPQYRSTAVPVGCDSVQVPTTAAISPHPVAIYPNPATSNVTIETEAETGGGWWVELYDLLGRRRFLQRMEQPLLRIGLEELEEGIYFVRISAHGEVIKQEKLIRIR